MKMMNKQPLPGWLAEIKERSGSDLDPTSADRLLALAIALKDALDADEGYVPRPSAESSRAYDRAKRLWEGGE